MHGDDTREPLSSPPDRALWQRSRQTDATVDDAERLLDLAGFAEGRLDPDDEERVAAWLAADPALAGDVALARRLAAEPEPPLAPEAVIARAAALMPPGDAQIIPFVPRSLRYARFEVVTRWGSLAAAMVVAGWLGFMLGMDASLMLAQVRQGGDDGFLRELVDPAPGLMRELAESTRT
jgi:anti-sigma factor RsiW